MRPVDLDELTRADQIVCGTGIVLIVDLVFLPWQSIDLGLTTFTRSGVESPNALWAVLAVVLTVAVVAVTLLRALQPDAALPELPVRWAQATFAGTVAVLGLLVLKLSVETDDLGVGAWLGVLLAVGMAGGATLRNRATPRNC